MHAQYNNCTVQYKNVKSFVSPFRNKKKLNTHSQWTSSLYFFFKIDYLKNGTGRTNMLKSGPVNLSIQKNGKQFLSTITQTVDCSSFTIIDIMILS